MPKVSTYKRIQIQIHTIRNKSKGVTGKSFRKVSIHISAHSIQMEISQEQNWTEHELFEAIIQVSEMVAKLFAAIIQLFEMVAKLFAAIIQQQRPCRRHKSFLPAFLANGKNFGS